MSMNYVFGVPLFLLILVGFNIYFFYTFLPSTKSSINHQLPTAKKLFNYRAPSIKLDVSRNVFQDINDYLNYLPSLYRNRNPKFKPVQKALLTVFRTINNKYEDVWSHSSFLDSNSILPYEGGVPGQILHAMKISPIALADNAPKGTQLKLLLLLEGNRKLYFKPKRYELNDVITGNIYGGFDRHNSEVFAYYLATVMNFTWIPPSVIRRINLEKEVIPVATVGLKRATIRNANGARCIYGKCFYCKVNETVCPNPKGEIEGAAIFYIDKPFRKYDSPWRRSYNTRQMSWQEDKDFCKKLNITKVATLQHSTELHRILELIDVSIFDFLIQNGDRHHYEVYKNKILLIDNGKGLGNPLVDELDILAPLYQCCMLRLSTWHRLEILSGGSLTETVKMLSAYQSEKLATEDHFKAVERRLLKVYATVQYCIGKYGSAKVFKD